MATWGVLLFDCLEDFYGHTFCWFALVSLWQDF